MKTKGVIMGKQMQKLQSPQTMEKPRVVDVNAYIDSNNGIYVGARIVRELHSRIMAEKGARQDRITMEELITEALIEKFIG